MLWECWQYLATPCPHHLRQMGYLSELIAIRPRYDRSRKLWEPHLRQTKDFILAGATRCVHRRRVVFLGSGWLLDVPLEELAGMFNEVHLVDIIHPLAARKAAARHPNVHVLSLDVAGVAKPVFEAAARMGRTMQKEALSFQVERQPSGWLEGDYVVSVNLLSQLPVVPRELLTKLRDHHGRALYEESEMRSFARAVVEHHGRILQQAGSITCLVTDVEEITLDREGRTTARRDLLAGFELPPAEREWTWGFSDFGEASSSEKTTRRVIGLYLSGQ